MGFDSLMESISVIESLKESLSAYDKKCTSLYNLADQITGIERCEKGLFNLHQDTFHHLQSSITSKMISELHSLTLIISDMEMQKTSMESVVTRMESQCKSLINTSPNSEAFAQLRTVYAISNYLTTLIDMKRFHLETMDPSDVKSISKARKDTSCKPIEKELDRYVAASKKK